jgi:hypothetical protein
MGGFLSTDLDKRYVICIFISFLCTTIPLMLIAVCPDVIELSCVLGMNRMMDDHVHT